MNQLGMIGVGQQLILVLVPEVFDREVQYGVFPASKLMSAFTRVGSVRIPVADVPTAVRWYRVNLGARPSPYSFEDLAVLEFDGFSSPELQLVRVNDAVRLRLHDSDGEPLAAFSLFCEGARDVYLSLKQRGVTIYAPYENEDGQMTFVCEDLDGNFVCITDIDGA